MNLKSNKSLLIAALVCTFLAIVTYFSSWLDVVYMDYSVWSTADMFEKVGRYGDISEAIALTWALRAGAGLAIVLLVYDCYRIAKPLLNGEHELSAAKSAGIGCIASIIFVVAFFLLVKAANKEVGLEAASMTVWPFVNVLLCIAYKVIVGWIDTSVPGPEPPKPPVRPDPVPGVVPGKKPNPRQAPESGYEEIPVTNYDPSSLLQPSVLRYYPDKGDASLIMAVYTDPDLVQAIRVRFKFRSVFDDWYTTETMAFMKLEKQATKHINYFVTECAVIETLKTHRKEIESVQVIIDGIKSHDNSIQKPIDNKTVKVSIEALKLLKGGSDKDAVCEKRIAEDGWLCICGKDNRASAEKCTRCGRAKIKSVYDVLIDRIDEAKNTEELFGALNDAIDGGAADLQPVKEFCMSCRDLSTPEIKRQMKARVLELQARPVPKKIICKNCFQKIPSGSDVCPYCGMRIGATDDIVEPVKPACRTCPNGHISYDSKLKYCPECGMPYDDATNHGIPGGGSRIGGGSAPVEEDSNMGKHSYPTGLSAPTDDDLRRKS